MEHGPLEDDFPIPAGNLPAGHLPTLSRSAKSGRDNWGRLPIIHSDFIDGIQPVGCESRRHGAHTPKAAATLGGRVWQAYTALLEVLRGACALAARSMINIIS